ncbi:MAG: hypothetical protein IKM91_05870, partial [Candidatus Methanomethylophilaceae archaeon]|nr:hypothetical protein [Candidatus Methanomethylophilaceae archaeon]
WNWIAYTPLTTMTVDEALAAANPQTGDIVKSQTGVAIYGPLNEVTKAQRELFEALGVNIQ